jgi:hypothetical protein
MREHVTASFRAGRQVRAASTTRASKSRFTYRRPSWRVPSSNITTRRARELHAASAPSYASSLAGFAICPRLLRDWKRIDVELLPPCGLIARAMKLAVMDPANRNSKLVAHLASERTRWQPPSGSLDGESSSGRA